MFSQRHAIPAVVVALLLVGCMRYASWETFARTPGYRAPKAFPLVVVRSEVVRREDEAGFVMTTALAAQEDLRNQGIEVAIEEAREGYAPLPRVEVLFLTWDEGNRAERWASWGMAGMPPSSRT